ncbi:MAG: hypothetical protein WBM13_11170 [Bacteroidia bacterium]
MKNKFALNNMLEASTAMGIDITLTADAGYLINVVFIKKVKSALKIEKQVEGINSFEELGKIINPKAPFIVSVNGKGVIHKKIKYNESDNDITLLNKALPNATNEDFEVQKTQLNETEIILSIIRSETINKLAQQLIEQKLNNIVDFIIGPFTVNSILPLLNTNDDAKKYLSAGQYHLVIQNNQIIDVATKKDENYFAISVLGNTISSTLIIAFSSALSCYTKNTFGLKASKTIEHLKNEFQEKKKFEFRFAILLSASFLILFVNYFVFNYYWNKNEEQQAILLTNQSALQRYETFKNQYAYKKEFLERNGLLESSRTSYYADQLASQLPSSIQWTDLYIHPLEVQKNTNNNENLVFEKKIIQISGKCSKSVELNNWMKLIKEKSWVQKITLINYAQQSETDEGFFLLEVILNV